MISQLFILFLLFHRLFLKVSSILFSFLQNIFLILTIFFFFFEYFFHFPPSFLYFLLFNLYLIIFCTFLIVTVLNIADDNLCLLNKLCNLLLAHSSSFNQLLNTLCLFYHFLFEDITNLKLFLFSLLIAFKFIF